MRTATTTTINGEEVRIVISLENMDDKTPYVVASSDTRTAVSYLLSSELEDLAEEVAEKFGTRLS